MEKSNVMRDGGRWCDDKARMHKRWIYYGGKQERLKNETRILFFVEGTKISDIFWDYFCAEYVMYFLLGRICTKKKK